MISLLSANGSRMTSRSWSGRPSIWRFGRRRLDAASLITLRKSSMKSELVFRWLQGLIAQNFVYGKDLYIMKMRDLSGRELGMLVCMFVVCWGLRVIPQVPQSLPDLQVSADRVSQHE